MAELPIWLYFPRKVIVVGSEKMLTTNVNLTEHYSQFVDNRLASGQYKNASEVFRAGLCLLEQSTAKGLKSHIARLGRRAAKSSDG